MDKMRWGEASASVGSSCCISSESIDACMWVYSKAGTQLFGVRTAVGIHASTLTTRLLLLLLLRLKTETGPWD